MNCPDCDEIIRPKTHKCPNCGWGNTNQQGGDYRSSLPPANTVPVDIGGRVTWRPACRWETLGRRCKALARNHGVCDWHRSSVDHGDFQAFEEWIQGLYKAEGMEPLTRAEIGLEWAIVTGAGRWLETNEWGKVKRRSGVVRFQTADNQVPF